ncbi:hypothetical protein BURMUCF2_A1865 [Burkholderia multivorans CF2]|nr:hypothetical protein BURMUCF2_A1865 [Burkholderia multivorans CF2]
MGHGCLLCAVRAGARVRARPHSMTFGRTLEPRRDVRQHLGRHPD